MIEALPVVANDQLYLGIRVPLLFNGIMFIVMLAYIGSRFEGVEKRFEGVEKRFDAIDRRFDDMRDLWRAELRRVEEVIDARLRHLEERS